MVIACDLRGRQLIVGYLDIDDFKTLNTAYGESVVDRDVLPTFMRCVEAELFARGFAYRIGGDEYMTLLPNMEMEDAVGVLNKIRVNLAALQYAGIKSRTTVVRA
jgi:diguanylate cyclase (GGDEF)-like protein